MNREELERRVTEMIARRPALLEQIRNLANVRSVGVGLRIKGGNPTGELAYRVYVDIKVPHAAVPAGDMIPESFEGVPVDVIQIGRARRACWDKGTRPILGGLEVAPSPFDTMIDHRGTLSCVVTTSDGTQAILSNEHVLEFKTNIDKRVWQPHYDSCLGFDCNKIGASVDGFEDHFDHGGTLFWVDAAVAILDKGIGRRLQLRKIANSAAGGVTDVTLPPGVEGSVSINSDRMVVSIRNEKGTAVDTSRIASPASALPGTLVWKIGNTTKLTAGVVDDAFGTVTDDRTGEVNNNLVLIRAVAGYEKNGRAEFADEGDSGSLLLDLSNHVIGLVTGIYINRKSDGSEEHFVYACNIAPVLDRMKVSINVSPAPVAPTSGAVLPEEAEQLEEVDLGERLHAIERRVRVTGQGPALLGLIEGHASEIYALVTRVRAVTVVWHRHQGPAFVALFARTLRRGGPLPVEVNGVPLRSMLTAMAAVLRRHGSPGLSAGVELHESWIVDLLDGCGDVNEMLSRLETRPQEVSR